MLLLFPACSWQGGELRRAPCTNHVRQSRNVTSVPCAERVQSVCRGSGLVPRGRLLLHMSRRKCGIEKDHPWLVSYRSGR